MIYWFLYIFVYFSLISPYYAVKKVYAVWFFFCNFVIRSYENSVFYWK